MILNKTHKKLRVLFFYLLAKKFLKDRRYELMFYNILEKSYMKFCDKNELFVLHIDQSYYFHSKKLKKNKSKKPDYIHQEKYITFYVDVKSISRKFEQPTLSLEDYKRLLYAQNKVLFRPLLLAYPYNFTGDLYNVEFGYIPINKIHRFKAMQQDFIDCGYKFIRIPWDSLIPYTEVIKYLRIFN